MGCLKHDSQMHRHIERIAERYKLDTGGKPVVSAVILTCEQVDDILENVAARATGHDLGHQTAPSIRVHDDGSPHLACSYCGSPLTCDAEDAYLEIIGKRRSLQEKQSPRS